MLEPLSLARQLMDIPSPSGEEAAVAEFLERLLEGLGFSCERFEVEPGRFNVLARAGGSPRVVLCSHIDTVPPVFSSSEDETHLYGRGACDTKGIIAAMLAAGEQLLQKGIKDFVFLFVVAEETDSIGAKRANQDLAQLGSEFVIVGEPTESVFVSASKGAFTATVAFSGVAAHSAYPERGDSAITKLSRAVLEISSTDWGSDPHLGKTTANVGVVRGGLKPNIVPAAAEAEMIFRIVEPPAAIEAKLAKLLLPFDGKIVRSHGNAPVFMHVPAGAASTVVAFNTDVPHLGNLGKPILFGPGSILDAHTAGEKIAKADLLSAVGVYVQLVEDLLAAKD